MRLRTVFVRGVLGLGATLATLSIAQAQAQNCPASKPGPLPYKYEGAPTAAAITPCDLMTRLYKYADDSMMGRQVGTPYNIMATAYIESEVRRLGLAPAGTNGGYFQDIGVIHRAFDPASTLIVDGNVYKGGVDFLAMTSGTTRSVNNAQVLVWMIFDTAAAPTAEQLSGKLVALRMTPTPSSAELQAYPKTAAYQTYVSIVTGRSGAVGVISAGGDSIPAARLKSYTDPNGASFLLPSPAATVNIAVTSAVMNAILGSPFATAASGTVGKAVSADLRFSDSPRGGRNVVAVLPGSDPKLKGEYVAIGAHNDHIGFGPVAPNGEHDSMRIVNQHVRPAGAEGGRDLRANPITTEEWTKINADIADLRKIYPPRKDSIANGADDDGSGTVSVLEIAEAFAKGNIKPKRSILFVWHAGEEMGMWGSSYFMDHPTVPRDSIVAQLNIDMVGRGEATDVTGRSKDDQVLHGSPNYLQLVGSRRLSTELGNLVESVNTTKHHNLTFDYSEDADDHPQNIYCRSDHWSYAKWGVPVVFFTTGGHADYHQVTDEPQYIQYEHMARVDSLIFDIALATANLDHRVVVDHPKPNPAPATTCKQ